MSDEDSVRNFLKKNVRLLQSNKVLKSVDTIDGLYVPLESSTPSSSLMNKIESGGFIKLSHPRTNEQILVPVQPCQMEDDIPTPVDNLTDEELRELSDTLSNQEPNDAVFEARTDAVAQKEDVLMYYKTPVNRRRPKQYQGPVKSYLLLPAAHLLKFPNLNFTTAGTVLTRLNRSQFEMARCAGVLRLSSDAAPAVGSLQGQPLPPPEAPDAAEVTLPEGEEGSRDVLAAMERYAAAFRLRRVALGFTQGDVGDALEKMYGERLSQTTISRFEALSLSFRNMRNVMPIMQRWLSDVERAEREEMQAETTRVKEAPSTSAPDPADDETLRTLEIHGAGRWQPLTVRLSKSYKHVRKRRKRTTLNAEARLMLESVFERTRMPDHQEMRNLSECLDLPYEVIKSWFCNRRAKARRSNACQSNVGHRLRGILNIDPSEVAIVP